jgi:predicted 3-demethylubiquinone-9 3-methyltransferase (glyoxalase superfamily)
MSQATAKMATTQTATCKIATCLWFADQAEAAADFYVSTFRACGQPAERGGMMYYGENAPMPKGSVLTATFTLAGQEIIALNGGPIFTFSPAISLFVKCADQTEVDLFWEKLSEGGATNQCGWLTDRYGLSWQIVPIELGDMLRDPDRAKADRVMQALMKMTKLDLATLKKAYAGA